MALTEHAPAKINLGLHVLRQRPDGYHDIETVLHRINWRDTLTAEPAEDLTMTCSDPSLPTDDRNLCLQAARRLADAYGVTEGARLHLDKSVPYGAGLGGGSSDAAATLRLLGRLWNLDPTPQALHEIALGIGADVPFFLCRKPAAYATGRGGELSPLYRGEAPYRLPFPVLIAVPPVTVATPWAYEQVTPRETDRPDLRRLVQADDLARWRAALHNDFEAPVCDAYPAVENLRDRLSMNDDLYVSLSGSGGAIYVIASSTDELRRVQKRVQGPGVQTHVTQPGD